MRLARLSAVSLLLTGALGGSCTPPPSTNAYTPGLGEIMASTQARHTKLWFAGEAANWELADYELDELEEGFAAALEYHPTHKSSPEPLTFVLPKFMDGPVAELRDAIAAQDQAQYATAHDNLTRGCNACHTATEFTFNVVIRPTANPFTNQQFALNK